MNRYDSVAAMVYNMGWEEHIVRVQLVSSTEYGRHPSVLWRNGEIDIGATIERIESRENCTIIEQEGTFLVHCV